MELVICFGFAVSIFVLVILGVVGLVTAPTPILLGILVFGVMITQKSIDGLAEPEINVIEDKEQVELVQDDLVSKNKKEVAKSMTYRGSHYVSKVNVDLASRIPTPEKLKYRGVELTGKQGTQLEDV